MTESDAEIIQHVRLMDTPTDTDPRRRYTEAQLEMAIRLARRGAAMQWRPIEEAPKDGTHVLLFGKIDPATTFVLLTWKKPAVFSGYWDSLDEAWVPHGGTWEGPFMAVTHWMPLPPPPQEESHE